MTRRPPMVFNLACGLYFLKKAGASPEQPRSATARVLYIRTQRAVQSVFCDNINQRHLCYTWSTAERFGAEAEYMSKITFRADCDAWIWNTWSWSICSVNLLGVFSGPRTFSWLLAKDPQAFYSDNNKQSKTTFSQPLSDRRSWIPHRCCLYCCYTTIAGRCSHFVLLRRRLSADCVVYLPVVALRTDDSSSATPSAVVRI